MISRIARYFISDKEKFDQQCFDIATQILSLYVELLWNLQFTYCQEMNDVYEDLKELFGNIQDIFSGTSNKMMKQIRSLQNQDQTWRRELKVGDMVDVMLRDHDGSYISWEIGQIFYLPENLADLDQKLSLKVYNDIEGIEMKLFLWSLGFDKLGSHTGREKEWRESLQVGMHITCSPFQRQNKYLAIILETQNVDLPCLGYYNNQGRYDDEIGKYDGVDSRYDRIFNIYSTDVKRRLLSIQFKKELKYTKMVIFTKTLP
eukprot:403372457